MDETILTAEQCREKLLEMVKQICLYRWASVYIPCRPEKTDSKKVRLKKQQVLLLKMHQWAAEPRTFIQEMAWVPDVRDMFGASGMPPKLSPKGMVPLILYPKNIELIDLFVSAINTSGQKDIVGAKSRQQACTTLMEWLGLWAWLFRPSTDALFGTYKEELIDSGGKGHRTPDTMFGRLRLFLDAMVFCIPELKFNQHLKPRASSRSMAALRKWNANTSGLSDSNDVSMKIVRPRWIVHGQTMFAACEGNFIKGMMPGDSFGRSISATYALMDEMPHYDTEIKSQKQAGAKAWHACRASVKVRIGWGTPVLGGGHGGKFQQLIENEPETDVLRKFWFHWTDTPVYLYGGWWNCSDCKVQNPHSHKEPPGFGNVIEKKCRACGVSNRITARRLTSPWFETEKQRAQNDPVTIAAEYQIDFGAAIGDRFFDMFEKDVAIISRPDHNRCVTIEGFDPGQSIKNPAAYMVIRFDPVTATPRVVGYWMGCNNLIEWWVPFFKRWSPGQLSRMVVTHGHSRRMGRPWLEVFHYTEKDLWMLERIGQYPMGLIEGDKFGSHKQMTDSAYDTLMDYGVFVNWQYTSDREALVRKGRSWAARLEIDPEIAEVCPQSPLGSAWPCARAIFETAKPREHTGEARVKLDVSKQNPPHVSHGADAWFYICRAFSEDVRMMADSDGGFSPEQLETAPMLDFGEKGGIW